MPHLSPMHWLLALMSTTMFIFMMMSSNWWTQQTKFRTSFKSIKSTKSKWSWHL